MELERPKVELLKGMVNEWIKHPNTYELESSFGGPKGIDMTDFLSVIKRLKARFGGDAELQQEDRLTITLKDQSRFTIVDRAMIKKFCSDNRIVGKQFIAITKQSTGKESDVNLEEYGVHIKTRSEVPMNAKQVEMATQGWEQKPKAFRLITRWTFEDADLKFDASIVYSTPKVRVGDGNRFDYKWARSYVDYDIKSNAPIYEIEVELKHTEKNHSNPDYALATLIRGIGEVLRGIQKSPVLIRQTTKDAVIEEYKELLGQSEGKALFRGNPPKTLLYKNILPLDQQDDEGAKEGKVSLYEGYNVTDKADGLRVLVFCTKSGELFLIDMSMEVYRTGLQNETCRNCLLDAEWVTMNKQNKAIQQLCIFDVFIINGKDVSQLPFYTTEDEDMRHKRMSEWAVKWNDPENLKDLLPVKTKNPDGGVTSGPRVGSLKVAVKQFLFAKEGDTSIFSRAGEMLQITDSEDYIYHTDGLIFTPNAKGLPEKPGATFYEQFKWKPADDNTIDFLIEAVQDSKTRQEMIFVDVKGDDSSVMRYKQYKLNVKVSSDPILMNPRDSVLNEKGLPQSMLPGKKGMKIPVRKVPFDPDEFPDKYAGVCKIQLLEGQDYAITESNEPIQTNTIVEMRYDANEPDPEWRWKPLRIRHDKTARYAAALKATKGKGIGQRTLNGFESAMDVWISIHRPITRHMITTGALEPDKSEISAAIQPGDASINRYYQNSAPLESKQLIQSMANFHNYFIKEAVLLQPSVEKAPAKSLIDLAVGQGSDIGRWNRAGVNFVFGVDKAGYGIIDKKKGAYRRYINQKVSVAFANFAKEQKYKEDVAKGRQARPFVPTQMADMIFVQGDSSKYLPDGSSTDAENKEDADIMRVLFGNSPRATVPKLVTKHMGAFKEGAGVTTMMFALHYMFQSSEIFEGFLRNLESTVKIGGYFVGCCFDGETVFNLLRGVPNGQSVQRNIVRTDGTPVEIWSITRKYEENEFAEDETGFGKAIDVKFLSIGASYTEYLVPFKLLEKKLKTIGLRLLNAQERKDMKVDVFGKATPMFNLFEKSTAMFEDTWKHCKDQGGHQQFGMTPQVSEFSFLNRWFIFKRDNKRGEEEEAVDAGRMQQNLTLRAQGGGGDGNTEEEGKPAPDGTGKKEYEINDVFQFHLDAPMNDRFKIGDKSAARWLAPIARFPIYDENDNEYPSLDHYIAAMRYKYGAKTKDDKAVPNEFLQAMFGTEGSIHQRALRAEIRERGDKNIDDDQMKVILKEEYDDIQKQVKPSAIKANGFVSEEGEWSKHREHILREGLRQRWENDERFRKAVIALHKQKKYLLYYNPAVGMSYYGGMRRANKMIEGENMIGRIIMDLAGYTA